MRYYKTKSQPFTGSNYKEIRKKALVYYREIKSKSKKNRMSAQYILRKKKYFWIYFGVIYTRKTIGIKCDG